MSDRFIIENIKLFAVSKSDTNVDICSICQEALTKYCNKCILLKNDICSISVGSCSHKFHSHCIISWNRKCPLCNTRWKKESEYEIINEKNVKKKKQNINFNNLFNHSIPDKNEKQIDNIDEDIIYINNSELDLVNIFTNLSSEQ